MSSGPYCVGVDLSSKTLDLVRLDENHDEADWLAIPLVGDTAWERARSVRDHMPPPTWWSDVYLCAIEKPFGRSRLAQTVLMRTQGAVLAAIPAGVQLWEVTPDQWKDALGIKRSGKPSWADLPAGCFDEYWDQNARDALGIALYARDTNARGIAAVLGGDAAA